MDTVLAAAIAATRRRRRNRGLWRWRIGDAVPATSASNVRTYIDATGIVRLAPSGVARDADYSTGQRALLVEGERANLARYSEQLDNAAWQKGSAVVLTADVGIAPTGVASADRLGAIAGSGYGNCRQLQAAVAGDALYTISAFARKDTWRYFGLRAAGGGASPAGRHACFDFDTGAWTNTTGYAVRATALGGGWWRLAAWRTVTVAEDVWQAGMSLCVDASGFEFKTWTGTEAVFAWGGQLALGAFPGSYIPTAGAPVTRDPDAVSVAGVLPVGIHATRYERYFDLATQAIVERVVDVPSTSGDAVWTNDRAWYALAYDAGVRTLEQMQAIA